MKIALACDPAGLVLLPAVKKVLDEMHVAYEEYGIFENDTTRDYPVFAWRAARAVAEGKCDRGIILCGTGVGVSIAANKVKGIRCALLSDLMSAELTRLHNNTNMMAIGAGVVGENLALAIIDKWLTTPFSGEERHRRRIDKMMALEKE